MSTKVKRGLGLLVVAVLAAVIYAALVSVHTSGLVELVQWSIALVLVVAAAGSLLTGLVLVAWGLLSSVED
jgi:formate/nitrite transporter FocA (FNT family)